jgi:hypothetical protein
MVGQGDIHASYSGDSIGMGRPMKRLQEAGHSLPSSATATTASPADRSSAARRLFAMSRPIAGTPAETYLRSRGITHLAATGALQFHPACYYRDETGITRALPAMIAAVTDQGERITGVHRTWLAPGGAGKAKLATPRRAMGILLGHGVRFGFEPAHDPDIIAAGEGIESVLSLRMAVPGMPMIAGLSVAHLGAPRTARHLAAALHCRRQRRRGPGRHRAAEPPCAQSQYRNAAAPSGARGFQR